MGCTDNMSYKYGICKSYKGVTMLPCVSGLDRITVELDTEDPSLSILDLALLRLRDTLRILATTLNDLPLSIEEGGREGGRVCVFTLTLHNNEVCTYVAQNDFYRVAICSPQYATSCRPAYT